MTFIINYAAMICKSRPIFAFWHDNALISPWTCRRTANRITYILRNPLCCIKHIIKVTTLIKPRSLSIKSTCTTIRIAADAEALAHINLLYLSGIGNHIFIELHIIKLRIAKIKIRLSIIVNKNCRINIIPVRT